MKNKYFFCFLIKTKGLEADKHQDTEPLRTK